MDEQYLQELVANNMDNEEYTLGQVFDELGRREMALKQGLADEAGDPDAYPDPPADATLMGIGDTFADFGARMWKNYEPELYKLLCDEKHKDHETLMEALGQGAKALAIALVPSLVSLGALLPAFVVTLATIVGKQIVKEGLKTMCQMWEGSIKEKEKEEDSAEE